MGTVRLLSVSSIHLTVFTSDPPQLAISVQGQAATPGYTDIDLQPLESELSADGILDLALVGKPPRGIVPQVVTPVTASLLWTQDVERIIGVRVVARSGDLIRFLALQPAPVPEPIPMPSEPQLISELIGRPVRLIRPGDAVTADFIQNRVNIETDQRNRITRIWFG